MYNVSFVSEQAFLVVSDCLFFNGSTKMLFLSKFYTNSIYWLPRDNLINKRPVKSSYPHSFGVKGVSTVPHSCVFVCSWYRNTSSIEYLFLKGYSSVDCIFYFFGQDVIFLCWWDPAYVINCSWVKAWPSKNFLF